MAEAVCVVTEVLWSTPNVEGTPRSRGNRGKTDRFSQRGNGGWAVIFDRDYCVWNTGTVWTLGQGPFIHYFRNIHWMPAMFWSLFQVLGSSSDKEDSQELCPPRTLVLQDKQLYITANVNTSRITSDKCMEELAISYKMMGQGVRWLFLMDTYSVLFCHNGPKYPK